VAGQEKATVTITTGLGQTHSIDAVYADNAPQVTISGIHQWVSNDAVAPGSTDCFSPPGPAQLSFTTGVFVNLDRGTPSRCYWARLARAALQAGSPLIVASLSTAVSSTSSPLSQLPDTGSAPLAVPVIFVPHNDAVFILLTVRGDTTLKVKSDGSGGGESTAQAVPMHLAILATAAVILLVVLIFMAKVIMTPSHPVLPAEVVRDDDGGRAPTRSMVENNRLHSESRLRDLNSRSPSVVFKTADELKTDQPQMVEDAADTCAVCIDCFEPDSEVRCLECGHVFHKECIDPWLVDHGTCPLCKVLVLQHATLPPPQRAVHVMVQQGGGAQHWAHANTWLEDGDALLGPGGAADAGEHAAPATARDRGDDRRHSLELSHPHAIPEDADGPTPREAGRREITSAPPGQRRGGGVTVDDIDDDAPVDRLMEWLRANVDDDGGAADDNADGAAHAAVVINPVVMAAAAAARPSGGGGGEREDDDEGEGASPERRRRYSRFRELAAASPTEEVGRGSDRSAEQHA